MPWSRLRRVGVIDIGTNSCLLLVAEVREAAREYAIVADLSDVTQLGKGFYDAGRLVTEAMDRTLKALRAFREQADEHEVREFVITGTSVLRDASNGDEFLRVVEEEFGVAPDVLPGEEEARLSYLAVRRDPVLALPRDAPCVVTDIGGGSTELIVGGERIRQMASLDVGAVRLTESLVRSDPPLAQEVESVRARLRQAFEAAPEPTPDGVLVGVAGTVANLANVIVHRQAEPTDVHAFPVTAAHLGALIVEFSQMTTAERAAIPGMDPKRAGVILAGALILERVIEHFRRDCVLTSVRGLRFGVFYDHFLDDGEWTAVTS